MFGFFRFALSTILWIPGVLVGFSFAGSVHPVGDSLAVFRPIFTISLGAIALLLVLAGGRYRGALALAIAVASFFSMLPSAAPRDGKGQEVVVYQKNLLRLTVDTRKLEADILASGADIVALQEIDQRNQAILNNLRADFPYQHMCSYWSFGTLAVLSRWPASGPVLPCDEDDGLAAMMVDTGRHRLWVGSVHLSWPWPYKQAKDAARIANRLAPLNEPMVLAGDFNMVLWAHTLKEMARAGGMEPAGQAGATFTLPEVSYPVAIDHVFMPAGASDPEADRRPRFGSDHSGVVARFKLP